MLCSVMLSLGNYGLEQGAAIVTEILFLCWVVVPPHAVDVAL